MCWLLSGCGTLHADAGSGATGTRSPSAAESAVPWTLAAPIAVNGLSVAADDRTLQLDVQVPAGTNCTRGLQAAVDTVENGVIYVKVTFESRSMDRSSGCTHDERALTTVRLPVSVVGHPVMVNSSDVFTLSGATRPALRKCGKLGCDPAPTGCTSASYQQAMLVADTPQHTYWDDLGCDGHWLILELSTRMGPACGDASSGCKESALTTRWFFRATPDGWHALGTSGAAGCAGVLRMNPAFPEALCRHLPALKR
ncbi:hypothetical protein [Streptomyces sp. RKAG293]|uniref:hypothetical protein n=1 Tax=Streptomyces sp. RKAG293 TaxID=2893403 RepID=UPI002033ABA0|nr:hypothetical protein [Streptomyces sp. RKAG293]MCM2417182.1 hypothetical protein [Streptomyces sp. RKAG293]